MDEFDIERVGEPELASPVLIEGLPGVGHVGKLAAEHLLEEFDSSVVARIYSEHFPPQVTIEDGCAQLASIEFHAIDLSTARSESADTSSDLLVLTGDHQAQDPSGHYRLSETVLDLASQFGVERLFSLGGVPTGELIDEYSVIGAASSPSVVDELEGTVEFREDEPAGGIVGVSGLLLGLGARREMDAACLMGETSGYLVDPKSARAVLEVIQELLDFEVGYDSLEERAEEMEEVMKKIREMEQGAVSSPTDEDLRYIG